MVIPEFNQQVIANVPNLFCLGNFFCLKPVSDVIGGVCAERTANGIYVWKFYYPLFNRANELDLTLGQRLNKDDGYIESRGKTESSLGVEFANRIRPLVREVQDCSNYDSLIAFIEKNPRLIRNEWIMKTYAILLLFANRFKESEPLLKSLLAEKMPDGREQIKRDCSSLLQILKGRNPASEVVQQLESWKRETIVMLGLSES